MKQYEVYFNEYNVLMENSVYLPLVSGLLQCYAKKYPLICKRYRFMPFIFIRDNPQRIVLLYRNPAVAAFSVSMWNAGLSLNVAQRLKKKFPKCLIILGGPHVPFQAEDFFRTYPFVDVTVRGEGEQAFADILLRYVESRDFQGIPGISYRAPESDECIRNNEERQPIQDLDTIPSPYLEGAYEYLFCKDINFQAIIETNRGCPFLCSYCFWGQGGLNKRYRFFSLERVKNVVNWYGKKKIKYVFCADSNFGIFKRDLIITGYLAQIKRTYGFPEKFRVCYSKNTESTIYEIGKLLTQHDMEKGITMSRQTNSPKALCNVGRRNIKMSTYNNLQKKYNSENIPIYTELILGLPGETYRSFTQGIEAILASGIKNQLFVYFCQVYPNTELASAEYRKKFRITTVSLPLNEIHAALRPKEGIIEHEEIIVSTRSLSVEDWKKAAMVAWIMQLLHGLKLGFFILLYLVDRYHIRHVDFFEYIVFSRMKAGRIKIVKGIVSRLWGALDSILKGKTRSRVMAEFGLIYWEQEEASYLEISKHKESFYREMYELIKEYLKSVNVQYDADELREVIEYQKARVPDYKHFKEEKIYFTYNLPEYFDTHFLKNPKSLCRRPQAMAIKGKDYRGNKKAFAQEVVVYGRKSNKMIYPVTWYNVDA